MDRDLKPVSLPEMVECLTKAMLENEEYTHVISVKGTKTGLHHPAWVTNQSMWKAFIRRVGTPEMILAMNKVFKANKLEQDKLG